MLKYSGYKIGAFLVITLLLVLSSSSGLMAAASTTVSIDDVRVPSGGTATVELRALNVTDLAIFDITISYNASVVNVTGAENNPELGDSLNNLENARNGSVRLASYGYKHEGEGLDGDVLLSTLTLQAVGEIGDTSNLSIGINTLADSSEVDIPADVRNGSVSIIQAKEAEEGEGGSGGASGVSSDEPSSNIVMREIRDQYLYADRVVTYGFTSGVPVYELAVRATSNTGLISAQVELLKDLSGRVSGPPDGMVYKYTNKYTNIWLGRGDFGSQGVKEAFIRFRVSKDWISEHGVDSVLLMQYSDGGWVELETARIGESGGDLLYESSTDHLSSRFAIVGTVEETASTEESMPVSEEDLVETTPERAMEDEEVVGFPIPGFGAIFSLIGLLATVFLLRGRL
ncbi:MAG: PGF-pre-PGF domain-containing protein [Methanosarcinales archaeon]